MLHTTILYIYQMAIYNYIVRISNGYIQLYCTYIKWLYTTILYIYQMAIYNYIVHISNGYKSVTKSEKEQLNVRT